MTAKPRSIAIIGAGPVGLAAAAHALERGLEPVVLEQGPEIGHAVRQWSHVRMFSPWEFNIDKAAARLLSKAHWISPDLQHYPTGAELIDGYLEPLATRTDLSSRIRASSRVVAISRVGFDKLKSRGRETAPFEIRHLSGERFETIRADAVIDTSGTWFCPNPAAANGLHAIGERAVTGVVYGMPDLMGADRSTYAGKRVAVLGAGHSAIGTIIDLVLLADDAPGTRVIWIIRGDDPAKSFGGGVNDQLAARGALGTTFAKLIASGRVQIETGFAVTHTETTELGLRVGAGSSCCGRHVIVDQLIVATGFRPDFAFAQELRLALDPALECPSSLAPLIDPNEHSCGTVRPHGARELAQPEAGFYIAGMKSYGRAPTFLMLTGYEQVRSIVAEIAGDKEAAARVELALPETGVCSVSSNLEAASACCGGPALENAAASCAAAEMAKAAGDSGCGCSLTHSVTHPVTGKCCG